MSKHGVLLRGEENKKAGGFFVSGSIHVIMNVLGEITGVDEINQ